MGGKAIDMGAIVNRYYTPFMRVYGEECGDTHTFPLFAQNFGETLAKAMTSSSEVMNQYGYGIANMTLDDESAAWFLRSSLGDGFNCPEGSATKEAIKKMYAEGMRANEETSPVVRAAQGAKSSAALYDSWLKFREIYFGRADQMDRSIIAIGSQTAPADDQQYISPLNRARVNEIYGYASALINSADQAFPAFVSGISRLRDDSALTGIIRSQLIFMKFLHGQVLKIRENIDKSSNTDRKSLLCRLSGFHYFWKFMMNPLNWLARLFSEMHESIGRFAEVKLDQHAPNLTHGQPHLLAELIDRIILAAVKNDTKVTFWWDPNMNALVATSKSLAPFFKDKSIAGLAEMLAGKWYMEPFLKKLYGRLLNKVQTSEHLALPLQMDASTPSTPPPETEPSAGSDSGQNMNGGVFNADQGKTTQAQNTMPAGIAYASTQLQIAGPLAAPVQIAATAVFSAVNVGQPPAMGILFK
jgi:hypothetical protein